MVFARRIRGQVPQTRRQLVLNPALVQNLYLALRAANAFLRGGVLGLMLRVGNRRIASRRLSALQSRTVYGTFSPRANRARSLE